MMTKTQTKSWDMADHIQSAKDMVAYLEAALEDGDPALVAAVLDDIARATAKGRSARGSERVRAIR
jgi:probable addiction module antidote protein